MLAFLSCKDKKAGIPVSDFFSSPEKSNFKISPDGNYISYLKQYNQKQNIFVKPVNDTGEVRVTSFKDYNLRDYSWTFDNQILFTKPSFGDNGGHEIVTVDVQSLKTSVLFTSEPKVKMRMFNPNRYVPDVLTITMNKRDTAISDVYNLNIKTGDLKLYLINPGNFIDWFIEADGRIRLVKALDGVDETILFRPNENASFRPIMKNNFKNSVRFIGFTGEKNNFYALSNVGRDKIALVEINADNGKEERVLLDNGNSDIQRFEYLRSKRRLEMVAWETAKPQRHFFDKDIAALNNDLSKMLPDQQVNLASRDIAEEKFIVTTLADRNRDMVYFYDRTTKKLDKLSDNSKINPEDMCAMEPISYQASDGLLLNGYITYPEGADRENLPVVVIPHDGPFGRRDTWGYSAEIQFLASRGYAVFQVNYRGSSGYGKAFYNAGFKEQGGKIQQDILDGVNYLVAQKIADPAKIAIFGRGFGGFSALYAVSFYPQKYACAIAIDAPINAFTYVKELPSYLKTSMQRRYEMFGDPEKDAERLKSISPVFNKSKVKSPIIMFQGGKDQRLNTAELNGYVRDLQKHSNVPVTLHLDNNESWSGSTDSSRTQMYLKIEKFLHDNMLAKP